MIGEHNNPRHIVRALISSGDGQYLLLAKHAGEKHTFLPGGGIEDGETIEQALIRELGEELGIPAKDVLSITELQTYPHVWDDNGKPFHEINHVVECEIDPQTKNQIRSKEEHLAFEWHPISSLENAHFQPEGLLTSIENFYAGKSKKKS